MRLDRFVADMLAGYSRSRVQKWIALGAVLVDGTPSPAKRRLAGHEAIEVRVLPDDADRAFEPDPVPLSVVYENAAVLVIDKPPGLVVHPASGNWRGTLMNGLLYHRPGLAALPRAGIVHRLDKDTSGLMVVAKDEAAMLALVRALAERRVARRYLALAFGESAQQGLIDAPVGRDPRDRTRMAVTAHAGARGARTHLRRLAVGALAQQPVSLLECALETGRTHQIRVHLAHLGLPLVGDPVYGRADPRGELRRQALHAWLLAFVDPADGVRHVFSSRPPGDLVAAIEAAGIDFAACWSQLNADRGRERAAP
ncbi:MAG: RluA family pseudouridine synthase [Burkholderiales bacterium]|nr:MAG: RluA family pseudouridine synthase [Burkholderiales bacterium]